MGLPPSNLHFLRTLLLHIVAVRIRWSLAFGSGQQHFSTLSSLFSRAVGSYSKFCPGPFPAQMENRDTLFFLLSACREKVSSPHLYHHLTPPKIKTSRCHQRIKGGVGQTYVCKLTLACQLRAGGLCQPVFDKLSKLYCTLSNMT